MDLFLLCRKDTSDDTHKLKLFKRYLEDIVCTVKGNPKSTLSMRKPFTKLKTITCTFKNAESLQFQKSKCQKLSKKSVAFAFCKTDKQTTALLKQCQRYIKRAKILKK